MAFRDLIAVRVQIIKRKLIGVAISEPMTFTFETDHALIIIALLFIYLFLSRTFSWIALSGFQSTGNVLSFTCR